MTLEVGPYILAVGTAALIAYVVHRTGLWKKIPNIAVFILCFGLNAIAIPDWLLTGHWEWYNWINLVGIIFFGFAIWATVTKREGWTE